MDHDSVIIEPRRVPGDPDIDHPIILCLYEPFLEILRKELKIRKSVWKHLRFPSMNYGTTEVGGRTISILGTPLGAPQAALFLERLIAMGARKVVAFGCCGSLQRELGVGHVIIPTHALSEEGTSPHYPLPRGVVGKTDDKIAQVCSEKCRDHQLRPFWGKVWTTDALFRETREKAQNYCQEGILAVEMELSALFTIAAYRKIQLGALLVVSDELATLKWKSGFLNPGFWLASRKAAKIVIEACLSL